MVIVARVRQMSYHVTNHHWRSAMSTFHCNRISGGTKARVSMSLTVCQVPNLHAAEFWTTTLITFVALALVWLALFCPGGTNLFMTWVVVASPCVGWYRSKACPLLVVTIGYPLSPNLKNADQDVCAIEILRDNKYLAISDTVITLFLSKPWQRSCLHLNLQPASGFLQNCYNNGFSSVLPVSFRHLQNGVLGFVPVAGYPRLVANNDVKTTGAHNHGGKPPSNV